MSQVTKIRAKVQNQPADTTGMVTYNHNTYKYRFPESGKHEYELAVDRGDIDWVPIEQDTKAYETLESKVPNAVKAKLEEPSLWEKVKNKILAVINQKECGGTMNYSNYLQGGGQAPQASQIGEEELVQLVKEVVSGNQEAIGILEQLLQANPQLKDTVSQIAQSLQQQVQSMKCGGRVKKKALGSKITPKKVMAKGGCPCMIKKVGGRLIEVDSCTGLPVHKSGGNIQKFQNSGKITFAQWMAENGYGAYNSAAGRRELRKQYGITETDGAKANMQLWKELKANVQQSKASSQTTPKETTQQSASKQNSSSSTPSSQKKGTSSQQAQYEEAMRQWASNPATVRSIMGGNLFIDTNPEDLKTLQLFIKYANPDVAARARTSYNINPSSEDQSTAQQHNQTAALSQAQYRIADMAKKGMFTSTANGTMDPFYSRERLVEKVSQLYQQDKDLQNALKAQNMDINDFINQLERTYKGQLEHGNKVTNIARANKSGQVAAKKANDEMMTQWLTNEMRRATNTAAAAGANFVMNAPSLPAATVATAVHNVLNPEDRTSAEQFFDRQFGLHGGPRKLFGSGDNAEWDTGSGVLNFAGNVATDPMTWLFGKLLPGSNVTLEAGPGLYNYAAYGTTQAAPKLGQKIVTETTNYVPKVAKKITERGNWPRGQQITTMYGIPEYLGEVTKTVKVPTVIGGMPGFSFTPQAGAGMPPKITYQNTPLPEYQEQIQYVKDWGDDCVQKAFREAAARGAKEGEIISACGKSYVYKKDPNFTGRVTPVNPNPLEVGGTNDPIVTEVTHNVDYIPEAVKNLRIPSGHSAVVTNDYPLYHTPTYQMGQKTLNYNDYVSQ